MGVRPRRSIGCTSLTIYVSTRRKVVPSAGPALAGLFVATDPPFRASKRSRFAIGIWMLHLDYSVQEVLAPPLAGLSFIGWLLCVPLFFKGAGTPPSAEQRRGFSGDDWIGAGACQVHVRLSC
jgi:hypothetical protein